MLAGLAVERAVEAVQGVGQRHEARRHVGQGLRLLAGPGVQGLASGVGVVGQAGALEIIQQGARAWPGLGRAQDGGLRAGSPPQAKAEQRGAGQDQAAQLPIPQAVALDGQ